MSRQGYSSQERVGQHSRAESGSHTLGLLSYFHEHCRRIRNVSVVGHCRGRGWLTSSSRRRLVTAEENDSRIHNIYGELGV